MMPMVEAERSQVLAPLAVAKTSVVTAKKTKTTMAATRAPTSGRLRSRPTTETDANRSSGVLPWLWPWSVFLPVGGRPAQSLLPGPGAQRGVGQRVPLAANLETASAFSLVTKAGPE